MVITLGKYCVPAWFAFSQGAVLEEALIMHIAVLIFFCLGLFIMLRNKFSRVGYGSIIGTLMIIVAALSVEIILPKAYQDSFFTTLSAYQVVKGGTFFVDVISQYGYLYLLPWIILLMLFPDLPVTRESATVITGFFMVGFVIFFVYITSKFITRRAIFILTVLATMYYSFFIRTFAYPDTISLLSTPAFTPLRYTIWIIPFALLVVWCQRKKYWMHALFLIVSIFLLLYSFEIGVGVAISGFIIGIIYALNSSNWKRSVRNFFFICAATVVVLVGLITAYTLLFSGYFPHWELYVLFTTYFNSGVFMVPVGMHSEFSVFVFLYSFSFVYGLLVFLRKHDYSGLLYAYLGLIGLVQMPYYLGRSLMPTLYPVVFPGILLLGRITQDGSEYLLTSKKRMPLLLVISFSVLVLTSGSVKLVFYTLKHWFPIQQIVPLFKEELSQAFKQSTHAYTRETIFLQTFLPQECPLLMIDELENEKISLLDVRPATQYPFFQYYIFSKEQIDYIVEHPVYSTYCLFIDTFDMKNTGHEEAYEYYLQKVKPYTATLKEIPAWGVGLYVIHLPSASLHDYTLQL